VINVSRLCVVALSRKLKLTTTLDRAITQNPFYVPLNLETNKMIKLFITDFKKQYLYGDCHLEKGGHYFPLIGSRIKVKLFGIFWVTYKQN